MYRVPIICWWKLDFGLSIFVLIFLLINCVYISSLDHIIFFYLPVLLISKRFIQLALASALTLYTSIIPRPPSLLGAIIVLRFTLGGSIHYTMAKRNWISGKINAYIIMILPHKDKILAVQIFINFCI